jgi:transcriptional regulator with XRE-family HTH domain
LSTNPLPTDKHVGRRLRMRRLMLGMSQEKLADQLGLTFQQVQKYENGSNRISASRLLQLSNILGVPISFFFENAPRAPGRASGQAGASSLDYVNDFLASTEGLALAKAFMEIDDSALKRSIVRLIEGIVRKRS